MIKLLAGLLVLVCLPTGILSAQTDRCNGYPIDVYGNCTKTVVISRLTVQNTKGNLDLSLWAQGLGGGWKTAVTYFNLASHVIEAQVDFVGSDGNLASVFVYRSDDKSFTPISITDSQMAPGSSISLRALAVAKGGMMTEDLVSGYIMITFKSMNPIDLDAETAVSYGEELWFSHWYFDSIGNMLFKPSWLADPVTYSLLPGTFRYRFGLMPGNDTEGEKVGLSLANPSDAPVTAMLTLKCSNGTVVANGTTVVQPWTSMDSMLDAYFPGVFESGTLSVWTLEIVTTSGAVAPFAVKVKGDGGTALVDNFEPAVTGAAAAAMVKSLARPARFQR